MLFKPFKLLTKMKQEKNTSFNSINSVFWSFNIFLKVLEKMKEKYNIEKSDEKKKTQKLSHIAICINHAHRFFSKYYELTDKIEAYIIAMILNSKQKYKYFFHHWNKKHHAKIKKKTEAMYKEFCFNNNVAALLSIIDS